MFKLGGVENFRDFGGYSVNDGRRVRGGILFRSGHLGKATAEDAETILGLGVEVILDLRRAEERRRHPTGGWAAGCRVITSDLGHDHDPWLAFIRGSDLSVASFQRYLFDFYRAAPFDQQHVDLFSRHFAALAAITGATLIHCAAGKDRTGLIVALTQALIAVHRDDIVSDYLLTNRHRPYETSAKLLNQIITEAAGGRRPSEEAVRISIEVEAAYLEAAFDAIEREYGSLDRYFERALGVTPAIRAAIRARLTEAPE